MNQAVIERYVVFGDGDYIGAHLSHEDALAYINSERVPPIGNDEPEFPFEVYLIMHVKEGMPYRQKKLLVREDWDGRRYTYELIDEGFSLCSL